MRAQVAAEFMVVVSVILVLFFMLYMIYSSQLVNSQQANSNIVTMRVASAVQSAIDYVYLAGDGTVYNTTIETSGTNVTIANGVVEASSVYGAAYLPLLTDNVNATNISTGNMIVRNSGGVISIG